MIKNVFKKTKKVLKQKKSSDIEKLEKEMAQISSEFAKMPSLFVINTVRWWKLWNKKYLLTKKMKHDE